MHNDIIGLVLVFQVGFYLTSNCGSCRQCHVSWLKSNGRNGNIKGIDLLSKFWSCFCGLRSSNVKVWITAIQHINEINTLLYPWYVSLLCIIRASYMPENVNPPHAGQNPRPRTSRMLGGLNSAPNSPKEHEAAHYMVHTRIPRTRRPEIVSFRLTSGCADGIFCNIRSTG